MLNANGTGCLTRLQVGGTMMDPKCFPTCVSANKSTVALLLIALSMAVFLTCDPLFSQVNTGRILGTVTDQTGGVIAGASIAVTNTATGVARSLTTDQAGEYVAPNLNPGTYAVRATAMGFQTFDRQNITVGLGQDSRVDARLTPGQVTQTVEVTAAAPLLDTTSAVVSGTLDTQTILSLPMNGRNFQNLLVLRPGVATQPGGGTLTTTVNGLVPTPITTTSKDSITTSRKRGSPLPTRRCPSAMPPPSFPSTLSRNSTSRTMRLRNSAGGPAP